MEITGEHVIPASRQVVWEALNDPDILRDTIPGCETLEKVSDTEFTARVQAKVGPVKARFSGKVTLSDIDPPNGYRISGEGQGGVAGFAKGSAVVALTESAAGTVLAYSADAQVGGKLAQLGSRLIVGTARKMADDFFTRFVDRVGGASAGEGDEDEDGGAGVAGASAAAQPLVTGEEAAAPERKTLPPGVWIPCLVVGVVGLLAVVSP